MCADVALALTIALGLCLVAWRLPLAWRCLLLAVFCVEAPNLVLKIDPVLDCGLLCWGLLAFTETGWRLVWVTAALAALTAFAGLAKVSYLFGAALGLFLLAGEERLWSADDENESTCRWSHGLCSVISRPKGM